MINEFITEIRYATDIAMVMLIWLVQIIIYPAFRFIAPEKFKGWHHQYMKTISFIVMPLILLQSVCHGLLSVLEPSPMQWSANAAIAGAWIVTFTLSVPCHQKLQHSGYRIDTINRLVSTNWLRTLCWSLVPLVYTRGMGATDTKMKRIMGRVLRHVP